MEQYNRDFKGIWIPKEIWTNKDLTCTEKCLLSEIDSLDLGDGCFASNKYFSEIFGVSEVAISNAISKLKKLGFLKQISFDGRTRRLKGCIKVNFKADSTQTLNNNIDYNKDINTNININTNILEKKSKKSELFRTKKITKKESLFLELKEIIKTYTQDLEILEKLEIWLEGQFEISKLPTKCGIHETLKDLFCNYDKKEILEAISNSIKSGYPTIYPKHIQSFSRDGINLNAKSEDPQNIEEVKKYLGVNQVNRDKKSF